jgi:hypothetical protein
MTTLAHVVTFHYSDLGMLLSRAINSRNFGNPSARQQSAAAPSELLAIHVDFQAR